MNKATLLVLAGSIALWFSMPGCKTKEREQYTLRVRFPQGTEVKQGGPVYVDSIEVGTVSAVLSEPESVVAVATIEREDLTNAKLKPGIWASIRSDGGIDIDASEINAADKPLPSGTTISGRTRMEEVVRKYATWSTAAIAGCCLALIVLLLKLLKTIAKSILIAAVLCLSAGVACVAAPSIGAFLEADIYPRLQTATNERGGHPSQPATQASSQHSAASRVDPVDAPSHSPKDKRLDDFEGKARMIVEELRLPEPAWSAFFLCWLFSFVLLMTLVRLLYRAVDIGRRPTG